ncbi:MAG: hypothetical protein IT558_02205 [Alphaproteobacteria bacterium]|nr:hypothetical protein [Alphaproteobacteria bacterium]
MYQETFEKLDLADAATVLDRVNPRLDGVQFDPIQATVLAADIPFYPGFRLLDIADYTAMPPMRRFALCSPSEIAVLTFSNEPIYALNRKIPVKLSEGNIADYVRFFFTYVRGKHGRFIISESIDDIHWKEDPPPQARKAIGKMILPVTFVERDAAGIFHLVATMMFKDSLFKSKIQVRPDGLVSLSDEELLVEDMPVLDDTFGQ